MAIINQLSNTASVLFNGNPVTSTPVITNLTLAPTIVKTVSSPLASIGDTLTYTVTITNLGLSVISNLPFTDVLPAGCAYVDKSFAVNLTSATPVITGHTLTYTIPTIAALGTATITFQVTVTGGSI